MARFSLVLPLLAPMAALAALLSACDEDVPVTPAPDAGGGVTTFDSSTSSASASAARGQELYGRYCDFCHGDRGQGYVADQAPALANEEFLAIASDDFLKQSIARGRPGTVMSGWGREKGGPLDEASVDSIVAYLRTWQKRPFVSVDDRTVTGDAVRGAAEYETRCKDCHGEKGAGGRMTSIANPEFLALASDGFLATSIERGRPSTEMVPFQTTLDAVTISDLVAAVRSWQKPLENLSVPLPPQPGGLGTVVLNPGGPEPNFDAAADFIPADLVKAELDRGATMVIADARAPSDYVNMHIAGAIDVPFYQVEPYVGQIPKERFVVTYCACPHAESARSRNEFRRLGYRSSGIDEGVFVWRDRGYPVRGGANP